MSLNNLSNSYSTNSSYISFFNQNQKLNNSAKSNQESSTANNTQKEEIEKKIADILQRGSQDKEEFFYTRKTMHPTIMQQNGDGNTQLKNHIEKMKYLKNNVSLPTENEFQASLSYLNKRNPFYFNKSL